MKIRAWLKTITGYKNERGMSLIEAAVAVLLLGGCVTTLVLGMSGGALAVEKDDQEVTAQGLARTQIELIKDSLFDTSYPAVTAPEGYAVSVSIDPVPDADGDIQKITATVLRGGTAVFALQDYKVNR